MIASILGGIGAAPWAKTALRYGAIVLAIVLFLLSIRRSGARLSQLSRKRTGLVHCSSATQPWSLQTRCWLPFLLMM